jgi:Chlorophyllase enzyme
VRKLTTLLAAILLLSIALSGCMPPAPAPPASLPPIAPARDLPVGIQQFQFTDTTRGIPAFGAFPGSAVRPITTSVWYPTDRSHGPYPLVIFAPGYDVNGDFYAALLQRIASAGYVVAAPTYPILSGYPAGPSDSIDWNEKFPDTWFVTSSLLSLSASGDPTLGGLIDPERIAVAGHSDGALISFGDGYEAWRNDPRVRAVISYAALLGEPGTIYQPNGRPFLHFLSDQDQYNNLDAALAWDHTNLADPSSTVVLRNATHAPPYTDPSDPHFDLVVRTTTDFLDAELKGQSPAWFSLDIATRPDLASFQ